MLLDVRGEMCPYPAMRTKQTLKGLANGEALEVLTDHPPALATVPFEGARQGYEADIDPLGPGEWRITLRKVATSYDPKAVMQRVSARLAELEVEA
ncbi:MAG: sulfurtransferase TusA family protein [Chloroflexi bacterium]|nr:sulfurtransferase TusA family protein [Chloroflexota bacterium]